MTKPLIAIILFASLIALQGMIARGDLGPNVREGYCLFWGMECRK